MHQAGVSPHKVCIQLNGLLVTALWQLNGLLVTALWMPAAVGLVCTVPGAGQLLATIRVTQMQQGFRARPAASLPPSVKEAS